MSAQEPSHNSKNNKLYGKTSLLNVSSRLMLTYMNKFAQGVSRPDPRPERMPNDCQSFEILPAGHLLRSPTTGIDDPIPIKLSALRKRWGKQKLKLAVIKAKYGETQLVNRHPRMIVNRDKSRAQTVFEPVCR